VFRADLDWDTGVTNSEDLCWEFGSVFTVVEFSTREEGEGI
jgi:hypothetical protein